MTSKLGMVDRQAIYLQAIQEVYPDLSVRSARFHNNQGQFSDVLIINEEAIFRFPRYPDGIESMLREVQILSRIRGCTTLPVPDPIYTSRDTNTPGKVFMGYRMLPGDHIADTAYLDADLLVTIQQDYDMNLVGPTRPDTAWQARQDTKGFSAFDFTVAGEPCQATCPAGKTSQYWLPAISIHGNPVIKNKFAKPDCCPCSLKIHWNHA